MQRELVRVEERVREQTAVSDRAEDVLRIRSPDIPVLVRHHAGESQQRDIRADGTRERFVRYHSERRSKSYERI